MTIGQIWDSRKDEMKKIKEEGEENYDWLSNKIFMEK